MDIYGTSFSIESMKVIAESIGIPNLPDDAAKELSDNITYCCKVIIQDSFKCMSHSKRVKLLPVDIDDALNMKNIEPIYGLTVSQFLPFKHASGGGRELHFTDEKEVDFEDLLTNLNPKSALETHLRTHWLAIEGVQPTVPENPPPVDKSAQKLESIDPISKLGKKDKDTSGKPTSAKLEKLRNVETVHVKQLATHELSVEQQLYYKEITEACVGSDEGRRFEALQSLATDPGLHEMLPRMCTFIAEGVKVNVVQNNLALLIYLMRMVKALLDNQSLYLEKYLHELLPSILSCIVSKQLCGRPEADNHWALRDFASRLLTQVSKNFNTSTNNIQTRVTRLLSNAINDPKINFPSLYGAIAGLCELGPEVIKVFLLPKLKDIRDRLEPSWNLEGQSLTSTEKLPVNEASHIRAVLIKALTPVLKELKSPPDHLEEYRQEFGAYLGSKLHTSVTKARSASGHVNTPAQQSTVQTSSNIMQSGVNSRLISGGSGGGAVSQRPTILSSSGTPSTGTAAQQKYVILTSRQGQARDNTLTSNQPLQMGSSPAQVVKLGGQNPPVQTGQKMIVLSNNSNPPALTGTGAPKTKTVTFISSQDQMEFE
ncbi:hypothetical protein M8J77_012916 [Diaphorina citri]|nr:hypothetical protein M8J77_012916 [Diaphorina citri]